jgi:hypothetical protein
MTKPIIDQLRRWFAQKPTGYLDDCFKRFNVNQTLITALKHLQVKGELAIDMEYSYSAPKSPKLSGEMESSSEVKQTAMWRSIRGLAKVSRVISQDEARRIAEVEERYFRRYVRFLESEGYVARRPTGLAVLDKAMNHAETPLFVRADKKALDAGGQLMETRAGVNNLDVEKADEVEAAEVEVANDPD